MWGRGGEAVVVRRGGLRGKTFQACSHGNARSTCSRERGREAHPGLKFPGRMRRRRCRPVFVLTANSRAVHTRELRGRRERGRLHERVTWRTRRRCVVQLPPRIRAEERNSPPPSLYLPRAPEEFGMNDERDDRTSEACCRCSGVPSIGYSSLRKYHLRS